jgi:septal ring factor EnvC (AmiA/AmiB activator)
MGERSGKGTARGLTLATPPGAAVVAPASGRIAYAGRFRGYGDIVIIDHGHGWKSVLAGLASTNIDAGGRAVAGQPIGRMGQVRQPRLTIELRHDGRAVDVAGMAAYR